MSPLSRAYTLKVCPARSSESPVGIKKMGYLMHRSYTIILPPQYIENNSYAQIEVFQIEVNYLLFKQKVIVYKNKLGTHIDTYMRTMYFLN